MAIVGIFGEGSLDEIQAMANLMPHRGSVLSAWSPAPGVFLGELSNVASTEGGSDAVALDVDKATCLPAAVSSGSRSEFVRQLYATLGNEGLESTLLQINGNFGLAIWLGDENRLVVACDRMFYKGIYWTRLEDRIAFATEYKAFLALDDFVARPDKDVIGKYIRSKLAHPTRCMLKDVRPLGPGRYLDLQSNKLKVKDYWLPKLSRTKRSLSANASLLTTKLKQAIERQSAGYDEIGMTLSGGIDSTVILAMLRDLRPDMPVSTYTIGYDKTDSEIVLARRTAEHIGTDHQEIIADVRKLPADLPGFVWQTEECIGREEGWLQTQVLSRIAKEVGNVMSGLFADVLFCGMPRYRLLWFRDMAPPLLRTPLSELYAYTQEKQQPTTMLGRLLVRRVYGADRPEAPPFAGTLGQPFEVPTSVDEYRVWKMKAMAGWLYHEPVERALNLDVMNPFCDNGVIDFSLSLPLSHMMGMKRQKKILRYAARNLLPQEILQRPKAIQTLKHDTSLAEVLQEMAAQKLLAGSLNDHGLIEAGYVERLMARANGSAYGIETAQTLWSLLCAEFWHRQFIVDRSPIHS